MLTWMRARNRAAAGASKDDEDKIGYWEAVRRMAAGADRSVANAPVNWHRKSWPSWPGWPGWPIKPHGTKKRQPSPAGMAANAGPYKIAESDLDDRLRGLYGGDESKAGLAVSSVAANLLKAQGYRILAGCATDSSNRQNGLPDGANMLVGKGSRRIAVQCMHRPSNAPVGPAEVKEFLKSCKKAGVRHAVIMTDA